MSFEEILEKEIQKLDALDNRIEQTTKIFKKDTLRLKHYHMKRKK